VAGTGRGWAKRATSAKRVRAPRELYPKSDLPPPLPAGFIAPCLPTKTTQLPSGGQWLHEIKHDGFRIIGRKSNGRVRLYSRPGNDFTRRFPLIGLEGIVSKRKDSAYRSGRSPDWLKLKNPSAAAVKQEAEEDWGR
jgi:ATP-dependent DNA ligase